MKKVSLKLIVLNILVLFVLTESCFSEGYYGPEWTFTNDEIIKESRKSGPSNIEDHKFKARNEFLDEFIRKIEPFSLDKDRGFIRLSETQWVKIGYDDFVIEVNTSPMTLKELEANEDKLQDLVWDSAHKAGVFAHERIGGGHIHLDRKSHFGSDVLLIRNFIADHFNNPELFMGALSHDYLNAPPVATFDRPHSESIMKAINDFDQIQKPKMKDIEKLISEIKRSYTFAFKLHFRDKYTSLNFHDSYATFELRGFRPQESARHYIAMVRLIEARIDYLKTIKTPIPINIPDYNDMFSEREVRDIHTFKTFLKPAMIAKAYKSFVETSGLSWLDYRDYIVDPKVKKAALALKVNSPKLQCQKFLGI